MSGKIESLITGSLTKDAEMKRGASGKEYLSMVVRIDSGGEKPHFCRANLFGDDCDSLAKLKKGDAVSLVGKLEVGIWKNGDVSVPSLSMMAHRAISPASKKPRKPASFDKNTPALFRKSAEFQSVRGGADIGDDLPWGES